MENERVSMAAPWGIGIGVCAVLGAIAAFAPAGVSAALIVPHAEGVREAPIVPQAVAAAPASAPQASPAPPSSGGSSGAAPPPAPAPSATPAQSPAPDPSGELEAAARHNFAGSPDFYARDPVGLIFQVLPMVPSAADQLSAYIVEQRDILATTNDLAAYLDVMGKIANAELVLGYIEGWTPTISTDVEAEARHHFVLSPDFYQRDPVGAIFSALPTVDQVTSIADELRAQLATSNNDPEAYFETLRTLTRVEETIGRLEAAREAQGQLETRAILGYSEVSDRECPYMDYAVMNDDDLRNTGAC